MCVWVCMGAYDRVWVCEYVCACIDISMYKCRHSHVEGRGWLRVLSLPCSLVWNRSREFCGNSPFSTFHFCYRSIGVPFRWGLGIWTQDLHSKCFYQLRHLSMLCLVVFLHGFPAQKKKERPWQNVINLMQKTGFVNILVTPMPPKCKSSKHAKWQAVQKRDPTQEDDPVNHLFNTIETASSSIGYWRKKKHIICFHKPDQNLHQIVHSDIYIHTYSHTFIFMHTRTHIFSDTHSDPPTYRTSKFNFFKCDFFHFDWEKQIY